MVTPLRLIFFGTPEFAVPSLRRLIESSHEVVGVVTQPDRPSGRGQRVTMPPIKSLAIEHGIPVWQPERLRDPMLLDTWRALNPDLGVVAAYGRILPEPLLQLPRLGMINVHASLLPRHRGAAPVHRAILAGDTETGVTIMRVVKALDAGPMLARVSTPIDPDETAETLERRLAKLGADLLVEIVDRLSTAPVPETEQDESLATYAPRLEKHEGTIDWGQPALAIHNRVRGLHPWPHASTSLEGRRYVVLRTAVEPPAASAGPDVAPGTIVEARGDRLVVQAGDGARVRLLEIQPEGRRPMSARELLAGHRFPPGAVFASPEPPSQD